MNTKIKKILKISAYVLLVIMVIAVIIYFVSITKNISTPEGREEFKVKIQELGIWGVLLLFGLELAQIFLAFLPGEPLEIFVGMCYGSVWGTVFLLVSILIITTAIYFLVKKYGRKLLVKLVKPEKLEKIENSKLFNDTKKLESLLIILFFIPGTPKDFLAYVGGILPVKPLHFILISTFARFPSIISSTIAGENILNGNWKIMAIAYGVTFAIVAIVLVIINIFDKDKNTIKAIKEIK